MKFSVSRRTKRAGTAAFVAAALCLSVPVGLTAASADTGATPVDGSPTIGDSLFPGIGNGGYDVDHYDVKLKFSYPNTIVATTIVDATALVPLKSFTLDFEGLTIDSVKVNGAPAQYSRSSDFPASSHKLRIRPSKALQPGAFSVEVAYSGTPVTHVDPDDAEEGWVATPDGATALGQPIGTMAWIPSNNTPADKATYKFSYTIPNQLDGQDLAAVGNGELISKTPVGANETTWVWEQREQMSTMATMVSIGKYLSYESQIQLASGRTIPEWTFVDPTVTSANQTTIQTRRGQLKQMLDFLESKYGPYPGNSTGIVVDITSLGYALETQDRPYFERSVSEGTLVHELAHQWFGDAISPRDWNHIWLSEGMATYAPHMWNEEVKGGTTAQTTNFNGWNSRNGNNSLWTPAPANMADGSQLFGSPVYTRGGMAWAALKDALNPSVFAQLLKEWNLRYTGTSQTTEELQALAEELSGRDFSDFFDIWVYSDGKPAAWPATWNLNLSSTPPAGAVEPGDIVTYRLSAQATGKAALTDGEVSVDVSELLDAATIYPQHLPAGLTLSGDTLRWKVPSTAIGSTSTIDFSARVKPSASSATMPVSAMATSHGATCVSCSVEYTTPAAQVDFTASVRGGAAADGWYRGAVTVDFNCSITGGQFTTACPESVVVTSGRDVEVSRTMTDGSGAEYTATAPAISIDNGKPVVKITGVKSGATYAGVGPKPACAASDALSGLAAKCALTVKRTPTSVKVSATAVDKVGNTGSASVSYKTRAVSLTKAKMKGSSYVVKSGKKYELVVLTSGSSAPRYLAPKSSKAPKGSGVAMRSAGVVDGVHVWKLTVKAKAPKHGSYQAGVRIGGKLTLLKMTR